jgi:hypothetical protein
VSDYLCDGLQSPQVEDERRRAAEKKAAEHRATDPQVMADAERLVAVWNEQPSETHVVHPEGGFSPITYPAD